MARRTRIAVIGAGIGGFAAACALREKGFEVQVYERAAELGEVGAGLQLGPNAVKVLRALGIEERRRRRAGGAAGAAGVRADEYRVGRVRRWAFALSRAVESRRRGAIRGAVSHRPPRRRARPAAGAIAR